MINKYLLGRIVSLAGVAAIIVSACAYQLNLSNSPGFGQHKVMGCVVGSMTVLSGIFLNLRHNQEGAYRHTGPVLLVLGAAILTASFYSDHLGFGIVRGFGVLQASGVMAGGCAVFSGIKRSLDSCSSNSDFIEV
jgi:hypothetical protein